MGYYVTLNDSTVRVPAEKQQAAYEALSALNDRNELKYGGRYPRDENGPAVGPRPDLWFSWMEWNYGETCKDLSDIIDMLGFEYILDDDGTLLITCYDSKSGQEDIFLDALAPFVEPGGYMVWQGEDGNIWRNEFDGVTMTTKRGRLVFD